MEEEKSTSPASMETLQAAVMNAPLPRVPKMKKSSRNVSKGRGWGWWILLMMVVVGTGCALMYRAELHVYRKEICRKVDQGYRVVVATPVVVYAKEYVLSLSIPVRLKQAVVHFKKHTVPLIRNVLIKGVDDVQTFLLERKNLASQKKHVVTRLNPAVLDVLVGSERGDVDGVWATTVSFLENVWELQKVASPHKGNVVMFVCTNADACQSTEDELAATAAPASVLKLYTVMGTDKGEIQSRLAQFLKHEPNGVVVIPRIERWDPVLISVLNNAIGEGGSLVVNGESISTTGATYFMTIEVPQSIVDAQDSPTNLTSAVKLYLTKKVFGDGVANADEMVTAVSVAFRRRIDVVAATSVLH